MIVEPLEEFTSFKIYMTEMAWAHSRCSTNIFLSLDFHGSCISSWDLPFVPTVFHGTHPCPPIRWTLGFLLKQPHPGLVSIIYNSLLSKDDKPLGVISSWNPELEGQGYDLDWDNIWINIPISSRSPAHQIIHYKFSHTLYHTIQTFYNENDRWSQLYKMWSERCWHIQYLHVFWECPPMFGLWSKVHSCLQNIMGFPIPMHPPLLIVNDDSSLSTNTRLTHRKIIIAGWTTC